MPGCAGTATLPSRAKPWISLPLPGALCVAGPIDLLPYYVSMVTAVVVVQNATVLDLKKAIQRYMQLKQEREGGVQHISWWVQQKCLPCATPGLCLGAL